MGSIPPPSCLQPGLYVQNGAKPTSVCVMRGLACYEAFSPEPSKHRVSGQRAAIMPLCLKAKFFSGGIF